MLFDLSPNWVLWVYVTDAVERCFIGSCAFNSHNWQCRNWVIGTIIAIHIFKTSVIRSTIALYLYNNTFYGSRQRWETPSSIMYMITEVDALWVLIGQQDHTNNILSFKTAVKQQLSMKETSSIQRQKNQHSGERKKDSSDSDSLNVNPLWTLSLLGSVSGLTAAYMYL